MDYFRSCSFLVIWIVSSVIGNYNRFVTLNETDNRERAAG